jgi:hypothetical protein
MIAARDTLAAEHLMIAARDTLAATSREVSDD